MAKRSSLRASDADRERVAEWLGQAATEGRILAHELEERLARVLRARTYGDLDAVVADLPSSRTPRRAPARARRLAAAHPFTAAAVVALTAVMIVALVAVVLAGLAILSGVFLVAALLMAQDRRHHRGRHLDPGARARVHSRQGRPARVTRSARG
jgi:Flp pilus assembly protein TadB